jgi:hypothetical protein
MALGMPKSSDLIAVACDYVIIYDFCCSSCAMDICKYIYVRDNTDILRCDG